MLSALVEGKDADLWFLVAVILFIVATVVALTDQIARYAIPLIAAGLTFVALGWLVL